MQLASVRGLKQELLEDTRLPPQFAETVGSNPSSQLLGFFKSAGVQAPSRVSIGVARGKGRGDYRIGARIHANRAVGTRIKRRIEQQCRGEADVRIVPHVAAGPARRTVGNGLPDQLQKRQRPLEPGVSLGHYQVTAGTLGCIVEDALGYYMLSNNHVLAHTNQGQAGDPVLQPGVADGGAVAGNVVGVLDHYVPISFHRSNVVDCAIAEIREGLEFWPGYSLAVGGPAGPGGQVIGQRVLTTRDLGKSVYKVGRTTGVTRGVITQVEMDGLRVEMSVAPATFSQQFEVQGVDGAFSLGGDSGSVIVDSQGYAVGLLSAGGPSTDGVDMTYANYLPRVLEKLDVDLVLE